MPHVPGSTLWCSLVLSSIVPMTRRPQPMRMSEVMRARKRMDSSGPSHPEGKFDPDSVKAVLAEVADTQLFNVEMRRRLSAELVLFHDSLRMNRERIPSPSSMGFAVSEAYASSSNANTTEPITTTFAHRDSGTSWSSRVTLFLGQYACATWHKTIPSKLRNFHRNAACRHQSVRLNQRTIETHYPWIHRL